MRRSRMNEGRKPFDNTPYELKNCAVDIYKKMYGYALKIAEDKSGEQVLPDNVITSVISIIRAYVSKTKSPNPEYVQTIIKETRDYVDFWRREYKKHPLKGKSYVDTPKFIAYDIIDNTIDIIEKRMSGDNGIEEAYNAIGTIQTVKNQLMNTLGNDYSFVGGGMMPKFTVQPNRYKDIEFDVSTENGGITVLPKVDGIPDYTDKRRNIAYMRAATIIADFIKDFVGKKSKIATERYSRTRKLRIEESDRKYRNRR